MITLTADTFAIDTYQITDDGKAEAIDDTFTIKKTGADAADASADTTDGSSDDTTLLQTPQTVLQIQQKPQIHLQMQQLKLLEIKIIFRK